MNPIYPRLLDLVDFGEFTTARQAGWINVREHPTMPLLIFNYSKVASYTPEALANPAVRICRGLVEHVPTGHVVARPWSKFFNYGDPMAGELDLHALVEVTDKSDGSLGILVPTDRNHYIVATRGSFISDQAIHATEVWKLRYEATWIPDRMWTFLFEIVYPDNRIVLDYGSLDDLILLGAVHIETGELAGPEDWGWPGPKAEVFEYATLSEALSVEPRPNSEGMVVRFIEHNRLVKIKQDDYVALHKIVTGLNERVVWEQGYGVGVLNELLGSLPDELYSWTRGVHDDLLARQSQIAQQAHRQYAHIFESATDRKSFALLATAQIEDRLVLACVFSLLDGRDILPMIWKSLKPSGATRPFEQSEDVA
jgi:RNA ligase